MRWDALSLLLRDRGRLYPSDCLPAFKADSDALPSHLLENVEEDLAADHLAREVKGLLELNKELGHW